MRTSYRWLPAAALLALVPAVAHAQFTTESEVGACQVCLSGCAGAWQGHQFFGPASDFGYLGMHTACVNGNRYPNDCATHSSCFGSGASIQTVDEARKLMKTLATASPVEIRALFQRHADVLTHNRERIALQLRGCNDEIIANLPLTPLQHRALLGG